MSRIFSGHKITTFLTIYTCDLATVGEKFCRKRTANSQPLTGRTGGEEGQENVKIRDCRSWNGTAKLEERIYNENSGGELSAWFSAVFFRYFFWGGGEAVRVYHSFGTLVFLLL